MQMDDMILVSIDDHIIEPPDMYENHVPDKWKDHAPKVVRNDNGVDEWVFQGETTSTPFGMAATVGWPREEWGFNPGAYSELRPGCFDVHERVAGHERQRRAGVDELPDHGRLQRPHLHRVVRQRDRAGHAAGLQRLGHRRVVRRLPGPVHPARHRPHVGRRPRRRGDAPAGGQGLPVDQLPRDPPRAGLPELPVRPLGPDAQGHLRREHGAVAPHRRRLRGDPASSRGAHRPPHGAGLPDQRHHRPGPALRSDAAAVPRPAGGPLRGRHRLDPLLLRPDRPPLPEPGLAPRRRRLRRASCPPRCSASTSWPATSPTPPACCCATASASTTSPGSATTPTPTPRGRSRPSSPGGSSRTRGCTDEEIHKITWQNASRFFGWDPFAHTPQDQATVGALRALATDVDTTRMSRDEWRQRNEAAGIGTL